MTAKADIIIGDAPDALQVPSAALRYRPQGVPAPAGTQVWVFENRSIRPVAVRVGVSNNGMTEIVSGSLSEGDRVVVGDAEDRTGSSPGAITQISAKLAEWIEPLQAAFTVR
jgi:HlyD family secretion protein